MMNIQEITKFEQYNIIYMNFSLDDSGKLWGLAEGDKAQHLMDNKRLADYETFLDSAIPYYEKLVRFDVDASKKLKKYKLYKKRLDNAKSKIVIPTQVNVMNQISAITEGIKDNEYPLSNGEIVRYEADINEYCIDDEIISIGQLEEMLYSELTGESMPESTF